MKATRCTIYSYYIYQSLHISGDYRLIIRRNNCVFVTLCNWCSVWLTVWYAGWNAIPLFYLQDYAQMHSQQNMTSVKHFSTTRRRVWSVWSFRRRNPNRVSLSSPVRNCAYFARFSYQLLSTPTVCTKLRKMHTCTVQNQKTCSLFETGFSESPVDKHPPRLDLSFSLCIVKYLHIAG